MLGQLSHGQAVGLMVANAAMWSIAGVVTRQLDSAQSFEITFWRSLFTVLSLLALLPLTQGRQVFARMRQGGTSLWLSGVCWSVMFTAFMLALTMTTVANVLITMALGPFFTALVARMVLGLRIDARTVGAIALAALGIAWMFGAEVASQGWLGFVVALGVPMAAAVNWTVVQRAQLRGLSVDLAPGVLIGAALSSLVTLPLSLPMQAQVSDVAWLALLGLVQLAIPCLLSVACAKVLQAPEVSLLALLEVVFGIFLAWVGAGEAPSSSVLWGGMLVLLSLCAHQGLAWRERKPSAPTP
ncbi:MAG: DMT family transporter [Betaproteobacteria bacterium]|nr:DMT family transporter [Betaproteobacteria bacterium]NBY04857.1 DMT family transporter [Betaproteobacteria bacterium]